MSEKLTAYIGIGSNIGDRSGNIDRALNMIRSMQKTEIRRISSLIETDPAGGPPQGKYLNGAIEIATDLSARRLLENLQQIESLMGRTRTIRWGPRIIDLDILLYGNDIIDEEGLVIPHPRMHERLFVLKPLCEIAPEAWHPVLRKIVRDLLESEICDRTDSK